MQHDEMEFEFFPDGPPFKAKSPSKAAVKGDAVIRRTPPLTAAEGRAIRERRERPLGKMMNPKLSQICVHLIGGDTKIGERDEYFR